MELKDLIIKIAGIMSISGYEFRGFEELDNVMYDGLIGGGYFDEYKTNATRNHIYIKKCGKPNAKKLLIDAHFDEIGMIVSDIKDGGFLTVSGIGGIDMRIMWASEVVIYGKEIITGIVVSTPPHLQGIPDERKWHDIKDMLIDTGYPKEELSEIVEIGTPIGFKPMYGELMNGQIIGKGFDNKACAAIVLQAVSGLEDFDWDTYVLLSSKEETSRLGAKTGVYLIDPDAAIVVDVNHAYTPDTPKHETCKMGEGPCISISITTNRSMTDFIINFAKDKEIPLQTVVEITDTGTNNTAITYGRQGIPSVVVSLPLKNMHTASEIFNITDAEALSKLLSEFIKGGLSQWN